MDKNSKTGNEVNNSDTDILVLTSSQFTLAEMDTAEAIVQNETKTQGAVFFRFKEDPDEVVDGFNSILDSDSENMSVALMTDPNDSSSFNRINMIDAAFILKGAELTAVNTSYAH